MKITFNTWALTLFHMRFYGGAKLMRGDMSPTTFICQIVNFWLKMTCLTSKFMFIQFSVDLVWFKCAAIYIYRYIQIVWKLNDDLHVNIWGDNLALPNEFSIVEREMPPNPQLCGKNFCCMVLSLGLMNNTSQNMSFPGYTRGILQVCEN